MSETKQDLISIVTPSYNAEKLIGRTIESVQAQSYKNWELIVVDDCSADGTVAVVEKYAEKDTRIRLVKLDKNHGAPAAPRNIGVRAASGEWVALLDADDIWHPRKLEFQMDALQVSGAVFCSSQMLDFVDDEKVYFANPEDVKIETISFSKQLRKFRTPTSSVVLKRGLLRDFPFNEDPRYKAREDLECWLKIHEEIGSSIKLLFPFLHYRIVQGQISGSKLKMALKTQLVLSEYVLASGQSLGWRAYFFSLTHILYSVYFRLIRRSL